MNRIPVTKRLLFCSRNIKLPERKLKNLSYRNKSYTLFTPRRLDIRAC